MVALHEGALGSPSSPAGVSPGVSVGGASEGEEREALGRSPAYARCDIGGCPVIRLV